MPHRPIVRCIAIVWIGSLAGCASPGPGGMVPDGGTPLPMDCRATVYRGTSYNCVELDRCTEDDFAYRYACCECDPALCDPDPTCMERPIDETPADSCMSCHNGSTRNDYAGPGQNNPHPFPGAENLRCIQCHGGNPDGAGKLGSHVPPPPEIGDRDQLLLDPHAYFNRLTLAGIDRFPDYEVDGVTYSALDYLQFINPGDLRVVRDLRSCGAGGCHSGEHADWVSNNPLSGSVGIFSGATYMAGIDNAIPEHVGLYEDTAADYAFRAVEDPGWTPADGIGTVGRLLEHPEHAVYGDRRGIYQNPLYDANDLGNYLYTAADGPDMANRIRPGSPLEHLWMTSTNAQCGDCHLGSAGANNRYGDFRSSGCTACHMEYSPDGRSRSRDPNVNRTEPANPDAIAAPERAHIDSHQIRNVAKFLPGGVFVRGISDYACVDCHQGSNRTVLQYWGIRLDQNQDVVNGNQYPANPADFDDTSRDDRLFDPAVANTTFNGRNAQQYILNEDYDDDGRDDTPPDVHYEAGLGCIDCHGSRDVHGGTRGDPTSGNIVSRMDQGVSIQCESCHGNIDDYAETIPCETYAGEMADCAVDRRGNPLRHVTRDDAGQYFLVSRLDGERHYVPQTHDTTVNTRVRNPIRGELVFTPGASYAMGRANDTLNDGIGPIQEDPLIPRAGFSHTDRLDCVSCHASWTNNCIGCHLRNEYDGNPANYYFSNITGERTSVFQTNADFTYITPVPMYLGVDSRGRITQAAAGMQSFYRYQDINGVESAVFAFSDRNGNGNNPGIAGRDAFGALSHDTMMPHSIRGRVQGDMEGPRYCVACHLNTDQIDNFGAAYAAFRANMAANNFGRLDFALLQQHIGQNPGNQLNSPFFVHMVAGLGSGLFLFDETGCPENPLDNNAARHFCPDGAPADNFDPNDVVYNLDGLVEPTGIQNSSSAHPAQDRAAVGAARAGSLTPNLSGPLGGELIQRLTDPDVGIVLDSWIDADGQPQGGAAAFLRVR